jgi:hypothetical protein
VQFVITSGADAVRQGLNRALGVPPLSLLSREDRSTAEIVLAEVFNNIVEHAYAGLDGSIRVWLSLDDRGLTCRIEDEGRPMPGGQAPAGRPPDPAGPARRRLWLAPDSQPQHRAQLSARRGGQPAVLFPSCGTIRGLTADCFASDETDAIRPLFPPKSAARAPPYGPCSCIRLHLGAGINSPHPVPAPGFFSRLSASFTPWQSPLGCPGRRDRCAISTCPDGPACMP